MILNLRELVYGLEEYEKAKLEDRYNLIKGILPKLSIDNLEDFEVLENVLFKIKEQIRVKSSNLNSVIRDPKRKLTKGEVNEIIDTLTKIKYGFLKTAFSVIETVKSKDVDEKNIVEEQQIEEPSQEKSVQGEVEFLSNDKFKAYVANGKVPYILVNFVEDVDFVILKKLSVLFFETYKSDGTNIISEGSRVLIVPRRIDDKIFELPTPSGIDIEDAFKKLNKEFSEGEFKEIKDVSEPIRVTSKKKEEDSLDSLISGIEEKKPIENIHGEVKENELEKEITFEKSDPIVVEREKEINNPEIEIEKKDPSEIIQHPHKDNPFLIYEDESIVVYLNKDSKVLGELIIEPTNSKSLKDLEESELSYISIFSKVFASVLFETLQAHGTNLIWDYSSEKLRIIPRYQEDKIKLDWDPRKDGDEFLSQIRDKLLKEMTKEITGEKTESKEEPSKEKKDHSREDKLQHLMKSIKRIP